MFVRSFMCVAVALGMVGVSSAEILDVQLVYMMSYDAAFAELGQGTAVPNPLPDGTTRTDITLLPGAMYHQFGLYLNVSGLAPDQDVVYTQYGVSTAGGAKLNIAALGGGYFALNNAAVDPPPMGTPVTDAPAAAPFTTISTYAMSGDTNATLVHDVFRDDSLYGFPATRKYYGDYAAFLQLGELDPYYIGDLFMEASAPGGTLGFTFPNNSIGGKFKIITGNIGGNAVGPTGAGEIYPSGYEGRGDSVLFTVIPEPGTLLLLTTGLLGLVCYAWRKRK